MQNSLSIRFVLAAHLLLEFTALAQMRVEKPGSANKFRGAETVKYCELATHSSAFDGKIIRVRALLQTDFEQTALTAPDCPSASLMTWVDLRGPWEKHTRWRLRRALGGVKWQVQTDVVLVGLFRAKGRFGHMDMYRSLLEVYRVESVKPLGNFRPLPLNSGRNP